ncbi:High osmolarity signaling protein [Trichinella spiralis]|uniref:High osmolarity signaling protein n=1 Tax=Trichinella spiralis TaxID=6334 RepID=A0ABR3K320_TRISP
MTRPRILPWLSAVFYYAANFTKIQEIIGCFEEEELLHIDDIHKIPGKKYKGKSNAQLIGMNIEFAVCFKYAPTDDIA